MASIYERVAPWIPVKPVAGSFGLEIETEVKSEDKYPEGFLQWKIDQFGHKKIETPQLKKWTGHIDNSLRNFGVEFVLKNPLDFDETKLALKDWGIKTKDIPFIQNSPSTSVHVHWNVMKENFMTMANFFVLYSLYENLLIQYSGPLRRSNLFALPIRVAETVIDNITGMLGKLQSGDPSKIRVGDNHSKYASLNLSSLSRFGSLEIRCFRGTTNVAEIEEWLSILNSMTMYAKSGGLSPPEIMSILKDKPEELFEATFGEFGAVLKESAAEDFDFLVEKNLWYPKMITESVSDWSKFDQCMDQSYEDYMKTMGPPKKRTSKPMLTPSNMDIANTAEALIAAGYNTSGYNPPPAATYVHSLNTLSQQLAAQPVNDVIETAWIDEPDSDIEDSFWD